MYIYTIQYTLYTHISIKQLNRDPLSDTPDDCNVPSILYMKRYVMDLCLIAL